MKFKELRTQAKPDMEKKIGEMRKDLVKLQVASQANSKTSGKIRQIKRTIAQHLTELKMREVTRNG